MTNGSEWVTAKYAGVCTLCKTDISPGDRIYWSSVEKKAWCKSCTDKSGIREQEPQEKNKERGSLSSLIRWEIITGDDGIIVLRRLP